MKLPIIECVEFSEWITKKYIEWRGKRIGKAASIAEFAKSLGASQQLMSDWMKSGGKKPRSQKYISKLVELYGNEVYEVLGLPRPDPLGEDFRRRLESALREAATLMLEKGVEPGSPEGERIIIEIADKFGFDAKKTSDE